MVTNNFRKEYCFFNKTIFTENNVPFPCSDDEKIFFFNNYAKFYTEIGTGQLNNTLKYSSPTGQLFLTSHRVIYKPSKTTEHFSSFHCGLNTIIYVLDDNFQFNVDDIYLASVYISFIDMTKGFFFNLLKKLTSLKTNEGNDHENSNELPYYCDIESGKF